MAALVWSEESGMSDEEDARDAARTLDGDLDAFGRIVGRWQGTLRALAFRFSGDTHLAEDLAQNAFLLAFRRLRQWRGEGRFGSWLLATALNVYRSARRVKAGHDPAREPNAEPAAPTEEARGEGERRAGIHRAVLGLPGPYRDAILVFYFFEANTKQAALLLGVPEGTLKARLSRGRDLLREALGESMDPEGRR